MIEGIVDRYQFNLIRVLANWDYYNPKPGVYQFDDIEQLLGICDEFGVRVLMTVLLESAPYWIEEAHPETRFVNAQGQALHLGGSGTHYTGGAPGLCFDWPVVREAAAAYIRELTRISAPHRCLYAYNIWNEPRQVDYESEDEVPGAAPQRPSEHLYCYCERTIGAFRTWLERRYETLARLNDAWVRRYPDWESIDPPRRLINMYADWMDWRQFIQERMTEEMHFRARAVRQGDPTRRLESHGGYDVPPLFSAAVNGVQHWRLAQAVDVYGCSFYPSWAVTPIDQAAATLEIARSYARGKDFWVSELAGNYANLGYLHESVMPARAVRVWNWLSVAAGAKAIIYWTYLTEGTGTEASAFGLVTRSGQSTERVEEAAKANRLIQARSDLLNRYRPKPEVAILFDQDNALLTFVGNATEEPSTQSAAGYYKAFWNLDLWVDFIEPSAIQYPQHKVLAAPWHLIGKRATCEALRTFVEQGGTLILESAFAKFDERYYINPVIPGNDLAEVFGYREKDSLMVEAGKLPAGALELAHIDSSSNDADIEFSWPTALHVKAHTYLTPIDARSAAPIATCHDWVVAAAKKLGRGKVVYIGTNLGASIATGDSGGIEFLRKIVAAVVQPPVTCSGALRPRLIEGAGRALLTVFNYSDVEHKEALSIRSRYTRATDIYTGERQAITGNILPLSIPFRDVRVFDLD
jgi:beta-galactosidase